MSKFSIGDSVTFIWGNKKNKNEVYNKIIGLVISKIKDNHPGGQFFVSSSDVRFQQNEKDIELKNTNTTLYTIQCQNGSYCITEENLNQAKILILEFFTNH